ncbi:MAG: clan AA aspartic protease [Chloroflexi bacterium]|nr:clan AA aspartic protease [Chloroflexota bacterium]
MGTCSVPIQVAHSAGQQFIQGEVLVDTGASHTLLPRNLLARLGIQPVDRVEFQLADDRAVEYEAGLARLRLGGRERSNASFLRPPCVRVGANGLRAYPPVNFEKRASCHHKQRRERRPKQDRSLVVMLQFVPRHL